MIPVTPQPEPTDFGETVRKPGRRWRSKQKLPRYQPPPDPSNLPVYWPRGQKQLWEAYQGVCAYLGMKPNAKAGCDFSERNAPQEG